MILKQSLLVFSDDCIENTTLIVGSIVGVLLLFGNILSYLTQVIAIVKKKHVKGISEFSIILLNIGSFCLSLNSVIFNWSKWECFEDNGCNFWYCNAIMLPFYQILMAYLNCSVYYITFIKYKLRNSSDNSWKGIVKVLLYMTMYILFVVVVVTISLFEKVYNAGPQQVKFFYVLAEVMGYVSAVCSAVVWIPQIIELIRIGQRGSVSPLMFILQTPGNVIIIVFQAVFFKQPVSTWISYVITCVEQAIILVIIGWFWWRDRRNQNEIVINQEEIKPLI
jgi:uncharacterized protein with PQ loop repeat